MYPDIQTRRVDKAAHACAVGREAEKIWIIQRPNDDAEASLNIKETRAGDRIDAETRILPRNVVEPRLLIRRNRHPASAKRLDAHGNPEQIGEHDRKPRSRARSVAQEARIGEEFAVGK